MFSKSSKLFISILIALILTISGIAFSPVHAAAALTGADWFGTSGNYPFNFDYNPQTTVNAQNVQNLGLKWVFAIPSAPANTPLNTQGVAVTPIIIGGIAYFITQWHGVYAIDINDGHIIWQRTLPVSYTDWVPVPGCGNFPCAHYHAIWNTAVARGGVPLIWIASNNYTVYALNALTGDVNLKFNPFSPQKEKIPGNFGTYDFFTPSILIDDKRGIMIFGESVPEFTSAGRGFFRGFDINSDPPKKLWDSFMIPPQDGSDPNWAINSVNSMVGAYTFDGTKAIDLKALTPQQQHDVLYADWGNMGYDGNRSYTGASPAWGGSWAYDPSTGIAYTGTIQPANFFNASTTRPGPNLWSDSVIAIDETTGKFMWAFQGQAHDLEDWDCSWGVTLANVTIAGQTGKTVFKTCKAGYTFALDAATGKLQWVFSPPERRWHQFDYFLNPLSKTDMQKPWPNYPSTAAYVSAGTGSESNTAYDPQTNLLFTTPFNNPRLIQCTDIPDRTHLQWGQSPAPCTTVPRVTPTPTFPANTTLYALDASTGKVVWQYFIDNVGARGGVSVSGGVVYYPGLDGVMRMFDEKTGKLISSVLVGGGMDSQPAIALTVNGDFRVLVPTIQSVTGRYAGAFGGPGATPGYIAALSVSAPPPAQTLTRTSISVSTVTQTTGIDPTTFYATAGVAVLFIIVAGALVIRRRTPAS